MSFQLIVNNSLELFDLELTQKIQEFEQFVKQINEFKQYLKSDDEKIASQKNFECVQFCKIFVMGL